LGGCFCGLVRYRCGALLYPPTLCHCESCRRVAGAHSVGWVTVAVETMEFTATKPAEFVSSPGVTRSFCGRCGTPLTYRGEGRQGEIDVILTTLDRAAEVAPADHIYMKDALPWDRPSDGLPRHLGTRHVDR